MADAQPALLDPQTLSNDEGDESAMYWSDQYRKLAAEYSQEMTIERHMCCHLKPLQHAPVPLSVSWYEILL